MSRSVRSRGDTVQLNFQVFPQESGERRITETVEPAYPEKESTQPRAPRPASSSTVGSASPEVRALTAELNLGQGTRLFGKGAEKGIQPFVRPPVAQMSPGLGTRLIGGIADRGNAQEQKRGDATKLGLRRRFELGSQFTMSSQQENLGGEKRQKIVNRLPSLGRSLKVTQIDADAQEPANLRSSGTSDALKVAATSFKDGGQANLLENEVYGGSPSTPFDGGSTGDKKNASHYLDNSSLPDSLTWNFQRDTPIIADAVNFHLVRASDAASNKIFENEGVLSSAINSRIEITSGMTTSISADPSANKTSIFSANPTSTTSLEYLSRGLAVLPNASSRTNSTASTRGGEPVRQIRRTVEPLAKHGVSSNKGRITGDIEAQIDLVISGTSKRLRDIQQDYGNGGLELYSKKGGYDQSEPGSGGVTSEGPGKKSPQEMDCNVPAFVAALERDSHSLASALCR